MGIFDFLKKIAKTSNVDTTGVSQGGARTPKRGENLFKALRLRKQGMFYKGQETLMEKLTFSEIEGWIENKIKENEIKEKEILFLVDEKIKNLINELKEKIIILEGFDVWARKEKEEIKNIVIDSRETYIGFVEELIERLNNLEESKLKKLIEKINKIFFDFNKGSFNNYERTTILIGKEMGSIKESLIVFSTNLLKIFDESKRVIDSFEGFLIIKEKLNMLNPIDKILKEISENKSDVNKKIIEKEEENRILKQSLEGIKISPSYVENLAKQKKIEFLREESKKNILELKQLLDFKTLASFFHINHEQMEIVKGHRENFQTNFEKDNGQTIIELLDEAKLNNDIILEKVNQIKANVEEIENHEKNLEEDETNEVHFKIKEILLEIDALKMEEIKEEKRGEKLKANKEEMINSLKREFSEMDVEVV